MTKEQSKELLAAATRWQEQGSRGKWKSQRSIELWDLIENIKNHQQDEPAPVDHPNVSTGELLNALANRALLFLFSKLAWPDHVV